MKIGIDISQLAFPNTGVANYLSSLVNELVKTEENEYVLFFSSMRRKLAPDFLKKVNYSNVQVKQFRIPPSILDFLWNRLHVFPIEWFIGDVDIFITSDWTEPPVVRAQKGTILYDLIAYKYAEETDSKIVRTQKKKLNWVKKESRIVLCISDATRKDAIELLGMNESRLQVIYPGV